MAQHFPHSTTGRSYAMTSAHTLPTIATFDRRLRILTALLTSPVIQYTASMVDFSGPAQRVIDRRSCPLPCIQGKTTGWVSRRPLTVLMSDRKRMQRLSRQSRQSGMARRFMPRPVPVVAPPAVTGRRDPGRPWA